MAICFDCWKLVKITDVKPRKVYWNGWRRWGYEIESEDLMKNHWDNDCPKAKAKTQDGSARLIQRAWRAYKLRPETLARRIWNMVRNDGTPNEKKYLGILPRSRDHYFINGKLIEFNNIADPFYSQNEYNLYSSGVWAREKKYQLRE